MSAATKSRRARERIGADEARTWARKLRIGNPYAKSILRAVANYMNEDGAAWPGIATLSQDTDIAEDTIVARLRWCESIGAIAIFKCWVDENGRRNHDGRGRVTSSEIRFLFDADLEEIEANAQAATKPKVLRGAALAAHEARAFSPRPDGEQTEEFSPRPQRELNQASPRLAPDQPPTPADRREELEEDSPPTPPLGGMQAEDGRAKEESEASEVDGWHEFKTAFEGDGDPIVRVSLAKQLFDALTPGERVQVTRAAEGLIAWRRRQRKPLAKPSAQTFIREIDAWSSWERHAPPAPVQRDPPVFVAEGSQAWQALRVVMAIRDDGEPIAHHIDGHGRGLMQPRAPAPAFLGLAQFAPVELGEIDTSGWRIVESGSQQCGAWREFIGAEPRNIFTGEVTQKNVLGRIVDWKVAIHGLRVPCEWPPRKDGSLCTGPPPFDPSELTEDFK